MKYYIGKRINPEEKTGSDIKVWIRDEDERKKLVHHVEHSPTGFCWGYGGSGPADLALSILWDYFETKPLTAMYMDFKFAFVATWGDYWRISTEEIGSWVNQWRAKNKQG